MPAPDIKSFANHAGQVILSKMKRIEKRCIENITATKKSAINRFEKPACSKKSPKITRPNCTIDEPMPANNMTAKAAGMIKAKIDADPCFSWMESLKR